MSTTLKQCDCGRVFRFKEGSHECRCGRSHSLEDGVHVVHIAAKPPAYEPKHDFPEEPDQGFLRRLGRYGLAVGKWIAAGRPTRSDEDVERLYKICAGGEGQEKCEFFTGYGCRKCGCAVRQSGNALTNKLRMATESCPLKKW